jgi:hypothetical protein
MNTYEEQKAFFERHWDGLRDAVEKGGAEGGLAWLDRFEDPLERRVLSLFARQGLVMKPWEGKSLDAYAAFVRGAIDRILAEGEAPGDPERKTKAKALANVISYNLAADLADCWPGEDVTRTRAHFEEGLRAARDCVRWRGELDNGAAPMSMALWVQGMHQVSLGQLDDAVASFQGSLEQAEEASVTDEDFAVLLGRGYLGLAQTMRGDADGRERYEAALAAFRKQLEDEERKNDAQFAIDQLETVRTRYTSEDPE